MDDGAPFTSWTEPKWTVLLGFKIPVQRYYYVHTATVTIDRKERQMVQEGKKESGFSSPKRIGGLRGASSRGILRDNRPRGNERKQT